MGTQRDVDLLHGIVIPDDRITADGMAARPLTGAGATATQSDFSQQSARPGIPASDDGSAMTLEATGEQTDKGHLEILTQRAGDAGIGGAGFVWRDIDAADAATEYKGQDGYQVVTGWDPFAWENGAVEPAHLNVCRLRSGKLLAAGIMDTGSNVDVYSYTPWTSTWEAVASPGVSDFTNIQCAITQLDRKYDGSSTERVLLFILTSDLRQVDVYASDDDGASWSNYARRVLDDQLLDSAGAAATPDRMEVAYSDSEMMLVFSYFDSGYAVRVASQWASANLGSTFAKIDIWKQSDVYWHGTVAARPGGGFVCSTMMVDVGPATYNYQTMTVGSAFDLASSSGTVAVAASLVAAAFAGTALGGDVWFDEDGVGYFLHPLEYSSGTKLAYALHRTVDGANTWTDYSAWVMDWPSLLDYPKSWSVESTGGRAFMVTRFASNGSSGYEDGAVTAIVLGGYSSQTVPTSTADANSYEPENLLTWGAKTDATGDALAWFPIEEPDGMGWAANGVGAATIDATGSLLLAPSAQTRYYSKAPAGTSANLAVEFSCELTAGDGDKTADDISVYIRLADAASYEYIAVIRLEDDGYNVWDPDAAANVNGSPIAVDMTSQVRFRVAIDDSGNVIVWHCTDAHVREWTKAVDGDVTSPGATANADLIEWGHRAANSDTSQWQAFHFSALAYHWSETDFGNFANSWTNPASLNALTLSSLPQLVFDGVKLAATSGPTRIGETWQIAADSQYPAAAVDPRVASSPSRGWRSADDSAQQILCWDIEPDYTDSGTWEGDAIACFVFGANWESGFLEAYNSSAGWVTLGQLVASDGFTTLEFTRRGRILYPDASQTIDGKRYFFREEHAGDTFDLGAAGDGGTRYHKIAHNAEGAWRGSGVTTKTPRVVLERDNLVSTDPASGTGELWRRDFGLIVSGVEALASYDHIRLRIPAQDTADGDLRIGTLVIGTVAVLARPYDWGWEYIHVQPISITNRPDDSIAARTTGKMRREIRFGWATTGIDVKQVNESIPDPDYVAIGSTDTPAGVEHDTSRQVEGIVRRSEQAACPVLLLTAIDHLNTGTTQKESRSRAMLLGRITTDPMTTAVLGDEGVDELERMQSITMVEEV